MNRSRTGRLSALKAAARERILVLDGAMGTAIQSYGLSEEAFRGTRFAGHSHDLKGDNDLLVLSQPDVISEIHRGYLDAGADLLETNTFNANSISQADYGLEALSHELNLAAARLARAAADAKTAETPDRHRWVIGAIGPTNRTASISPDVNDAAARNVTFDELVACYGEAADGLIEGGADLLMVETSFDTLNAKAALFAIDAVMERRGEQLPIMVSGTITDLSGRTLSGQTAEAFYNSVHHARLFSIGLNCALGAAQLRSHVAELSRVADTYVSAHPNAGLPNAFGGYDETPEETAAQLGAWARDGLVNFVGGCCGTTAAHIGAIAEAVAGVPPRVIPEVERRLRLSGLEPFTMPAASAA